MISIYEKIPDRDGEYYVMTCNIQVDVYRFIRTKRHSGKWILPSEEDRVLFWEEIIPHSEKEDDEWIRDNLDTITEGLGNPLISSRYKIKSYGFAIAKGLPECLAEHEWSYSHGEVMKIDDVYVIRII
ncbi:hypothetical protein [Kandleria sp.]|uniref:hypothetical protein n=1 Tax=Kandleria sp. TaxID=2774291 RepID=UPI001B77D803|nr:hypothetical protein [Kandleria sp.]MBP3276014.1 hypothetical protein [Kandleria sp.]